MGFSVLSKFILKCLLRIACTTAWNKNEGLLCFHKHSQCPCMTHKRGVYCITSQTQNPYIPIPRFHNALSRWNWDASNLLQHFGKIGQSASLNLSPLFDHAVVVQKSPGRFLCVGRDRSHQEAHQVTSIISFNSTFRGRFILRTNLNLNVAFQGLCPLKTNKMRAKYILRTL